MGLAVAMLGGIAKACARALGEQSRSLRCPGAMCNSEHVLAVRLRTEADLELAGPTLQNEAALKI